MVGVLGWALALVLAGHVADARQLRDPVAADVGEQLVILTSSTDLQQGLARVKQLVEDAAEQRSRGFLKDPLNSALVQEQWEWTLPLSALQSSWLFPGYTARLKLVLLKLLSGQTVKIGALGGSVTEGRLASREHDWFTLVTRWLQRAFPEAKIITKNGGVGATSPVFMENCYGERLEADVDLVFYEYAVNTKYRENLHHEEAAAYERLMRLILSGEHGAGAINGDIKPPATIMFNHWYCCWPDTNATRTTFLPYDRQMEDQFNVLAQYYGVPAVSVRDAFFHPFMRKEGVFSEMDESFPKDPYGGRLHPNDYGSRFLADLLVYAFYQVLDQLQTYGITSGDMALLRAPMPPPLASPPAAGRHIVVACWFQHRVKPVVVTTKSSKTWAFGTEAHEKSGFITQRAGDHLRIRVDTRVPNKVAALRPSAGTDESSEESGGHIGLRERDRGRGSREDSTPAVRPVVQIGLLKSYQHMGKTRIMCVSGCSCEPQVINTHEPSQHSSQTYFMPVEVTESKECDIELEALEETTSGEHKIKLSAVAVTMRITE